MTEPTRPILTIKRRNRTVYVPPEKAAKSEPQPDERTSSKAKVQPKAKTPQKPVQKPTAAVTKKTPEQVADGIRRQEENNKRQRDIAIANGSKKAAAKKVAREFIETHWPDLLKRGIQRRPFAKGITEQIMERGAELGMPPEVHRGIIKIIIGTAVYNSTAYQKAIIDRQMRYDIDNNPTEIPTEEEAEQARENLKQIQERRRAATAAAAAKFEARNAEREAKKAKKKGA